MFEKACTHIWSCRNQSYHHIRMASSPRLSYLVTNQVPPFFRRMVVSLTYVLLDRMANTYIWHGRNQSSHHDRMAQPLYLTYSSEWLWISALISDMEGTNPLTMTEWLSPYIWPWKDVDVYVTSECILLCILCIVTRCLLRDVFYYVFESCGHTLMFRSGGLIM